MSQQTPETHRILTQEGNSPLPTAHPSHEKLEAIPLDLWGRCGILVLGSFASMLTATIVSVALPTMAQQFGGTRDATQWVTSAFLLGLGMAIPLSSWAASRFGVTKLWLGCLALFTLISIACATANSLEYLIGLRLVLGLVGGLMVPAAQMQVGMLAGPKRAGRVMSVLGVPIILAPAIGVSIGGMLLSRYGWPSLFWINIPLCVVAGIAGLLWLPRIEKKGDSRFDTLGFVLLAIGLSLLTLGVSAFGHQTSEVIGSDAALFAIGVLFLLTFVSHARRTKQPILKTALLSRPGIVYAGLIVFAAGFITFGAQIVLPEFYLQVRGYDPDLTGILLLPQAIGMGIGLPTSGWLTDRHGAGHVVVAGAIVTALGTVALALFEASQPDWWFTTVLIVRGFGISMLSTPGLTKAVSLVDRDDVPNVIPIMNVLNRFGGGLGTALIFMAFQFALAWSSDPSAALTGFHVAHWVMVAVLLILMVPGFALARLEKRSV